MKRPGLVLLLMVGPVLFLVRAVVRYNEDQERMAKVFGTPEEQRAGTERIIASEQSAQEAGAAVGPQTTEQGCVDQGFEQERTQPPQYARLMNFLQGCLASAQPTPGFCDDVPPYAVTASAADEARTKAYQDALCRKEGFTDWQCRASVKVVQIHCHPFK
jgi:hypothetical protein